MSITTAPARGATGFSREAVEALSRHKQEPEWMRQFRLQAWETFERLPAPSRRDELWRRTDLSSVKLDAVVPWVAEAAGDQAIRHARELSTELAGTDKRAGLIVQHNSTPVLTELDPELQAKGVILTDLDTAVREHPDLVRQYFMSQCVPVHDSYYVALHAAFWSGGAFLYVPRGIEIDLPFQSITYADEPALGLFNHSLVVLEANSRVTFIDSLTSNDEHSQGFADDVTELIIGQGANLRCIHLQEWGPSVSSFSTQRAVCGRDSTINWLHVTLGGRMSRADIQGRLDNPGASAEMLGVYFGSEMQHFDHHTMQIHNAPNTMSDLLFKGTLTDRARSVFSGLIQVAKGAQKTDAYQLNRNLLLSDKARADSIPNLEIQANDVRCTHGASVGPVDPEQLFYLMSHGLTQTEATRMIVEGFFEPIVSRIPLEGVRERLWRSIEHKMRL